MLSGTPIVGSLGILIMRNLTRMTHPLTRMRTKTVTLVVVFDETRRLYYKVDHTVVADLHHRPFFTSAHRGLGATKIHSHPSSTSMTLVTPQAKAPKNTILSKDPR